MFKWQVQSGLQEDEKDLPAFKARGLSYWFFQWPAWAKKSRPTRNHLPVIHKSTNGKSILMNHFSIGHGKKIRRMSLAWLAWPWRHENATGDESKFNPPAAHFCCQPIFFCCFLLSHACLLYSFGPSLPTARQRSLQGFRWFLILGVIWNTPYLVGFQWNLFFVFSSMLLVMTPRQKRSLPCRAKMHGIVFCNYSRWELRAKKRGKDPCQFLFLQGDWFGPQLPVTKVGWWDCGVANSRRCRTWSGGVNGFPGAVGFGMTDSSKEEPSTKWIRLCKWKALVRSAISTNRKDTRCIHRLATSQEGYLAKSPLLAEAGTWKEDERTRWSDSATFWCLRSMRSWKAGQCLSCAFARLRWPVERCCQRLVESKVFSVNLQTDRARCGLLSWRCRRSHK